MRSNIFKIFNQSDSKSQDTPEAQKAGVPDKEVARTCLALADQYIKEGRFEKAQVELDKAKKLDPTNMYIDAFRERIMFFEQQRKKEILEKAHQATKEPQKKGAAAQPERTAAKGTQALKGVEQPATPDEMSLTAAKEEPSAPVREDAARVFTIKETPEQRGEAENQGKYVNEDVRQVEDQLSATSVEEQARKLEEERRFLQEEKVRLEDERRRIEEEERVRAQIELKRVEVDLQRKADEEGRRLAEERRRLEEERLRLEEERRKAEGDERKKLQMEFQRLEAQLQRRTDEDARRQEEMKRLETELQRKPGEDTVRRLEEELRKREEAYEKIARRETSRETGKGPPRQQVRECLGRAREFLGLREFDEALLEITKIYGFDLSPKEIEEGKRLEEEIRRAEKLETKKFIESELGEIKRQIEQLTHAIEEEKKAREELSKRQLQRAAKHYREALEYAWVNGAPNSVKAAEMHSLAISLSIPEAVENSLTREIKLEMYGRAVKEAIAKRDLVRNSASTMEWLRKVYEVTLDEYLEYESKFLVDLVADQFKGTILLVSSDLKLREDTAARLKASGYAIVLASTPDEAMEKIEKIHPQFIMSDTDFPEGPLSGIKFLHVIRGNGKFNYLPFILFCERKNIKEIESSELRSNEGYVKKPVAFRELTDVMEKKLQSYKEYIASLSS